MSGYYYYYYVLVYNIIAISTRMTVKQSQT